MGEAEQNIRQILEAETKKVPAEILKGATLMGPQQLFAGLMNIDKESSLTSSQLLVRPEKLVHV